MPKNIVVFSDGTGQDGGVGHDSNIYKIFKAAENRTDKQVVFYDRGVGTGWRKYIGGATGSGISKNIKECYQFIFENFEAGDKIFLFGFSRGAATVRSLSGFIHTFGILPKSRPELINKAYSIYKISDKVKRQKKAEDFCGRHNTMWTSIEFLGVWDTVSALGVPIKSIASILDRVTWWKHKFHDFQLSESVLHAYHALSIDDERLTFHPVLWEDKILEKKQTMEQVWFCGVHTDVGGGYKEDGLSNIPLKWMLDKAVAKDFRVYETGIFNLEGNPNGIMHDSRDGLGKLYRKQVRFWPKTDKHGEKRGEPVIHPSVYERTLGKDNTKGTDYKPWILNRDKN